MSELQMKFYFSIAVLCVACVVRGKYILATGIHRKTWRFAANVPRNVFYWQPILSWRWSGCRRPQPIAIRMLFTHHSPTPEIFHHHYLCELFIGQIHCRSHAFHLFSIYWFLLWNWHNWNIYEIWFLTCMAVLLNIVVNLVFKINFDLRDSFRETLTPSSATSEWSDWRNYSIGDYDFVCKKWDHFRWDPCRCPCHQRHSHFYRADGLFWISKWNFLLRMIEHCISHDEPTDTSAWSARCDWRKQWVKSQNRSRRINTKN